jgi:hypothetical protein
MNGTLFLRRSLSMLLASCFLVVSACSAQFNGLFVDDGGPSVPDPTDAREDVSAADVRLWDVLADKASDGPPSEGSSNDAARDGNLGRDAVFDGDPIRDARLDVDATRDAAQDANLDADASMDRGSEPPPDAREQDTSPDASDDVLIDATADVAREARADASTDATDAEPPGTCSGGCNTIVNISQTVVRTVDTGPPPTMTGGTIVDGTYVATGVVQYNGDSTAYSISETSIIAGNMDAWVSSINGQTPVRYMTTFITSGNLMIFTFCCPTVVNLTISYTTDGATLSYIDPANPNRLFIFTRQ